MATLSPATQRRRHGGMVNTVVGYALLIFFALVFIYPFVIQLANSLKTEPDAAANPLSPVPQPLTTAAFDRLLTGDFPLWLGNSVLMTVVITIGRVFLDSLAGYALARLRFGGRAALCRGGVARGPGREPARPD